MFHQTKESRYDRSTKRLADRDVPVAMYRPSPWSMRTSESERLQRLTEGRIKTPAERVDTFRSLRPERTTWDNLGLPAKPSRPVSAQVRRRQYADSLPARLGVPRCNAAASPNSKVMRISPSGPERQRPQSAMTALRRTAMRRRSLPENGSSFSEGIPKAPEAVVGVQEEKITHDIDKDSDAGSKDDLTFDMNHHGNLVQLAKELSMNIADIMLIKSVFQIYDVNKNGIIESNEFHKAVEELQQRQGCEVDMDKHGLRKMTENHWHAAVGNRGGLSFKDFVKWYCSYGFSEDLLLTSEERWLRRLAKEHGVSPEYVSEIKVMFDTYDKDKSGDVDMEEFERVLYMAMKVPQHVGLPMTRVQYFWSQVKVNRSGLVTFEEFLCWWKKYVDDSSARGMKHMPYENFYKQLHRIGHRSLDPLAYPKGMLSGWPTDDISSGR